MEKALYLQKLLIKTKPRKNPSCIQTNSSAGGILDATETLTLDVHTCPADDLDAVPDSAMTELPRPLGEAQGRGGSLLGCFAIRSRGYPRRRHGQQRVEVVEGLPPGGGLAPPAASACRPGQTLLLLLLERIEDCMPQVPTDPQEQWTLDLSNMKSVE